METKKRYLGIDVGGTFIKLGLVDGDGKVSLRREVAIDRSGNETVMETMTRGVDCFLLEHGLDALDLDGIGVSAAGCIDTANGRVANNGGNVPGWPHTEVTGPLTEKYGLPATIANDGNCVALAEAWTGAAMGKDDVICVVLGTGVGGGIISGGRLIEGARGFGGEIGHFPTHAEKKPAFRGDLSPDYEKHAATSALVGLAAAEGCSWTNGREIFNAAAEGNSDALRILDEWMYEIAAGIVGLVHVFDPETVIIGGGVSAQEDLLVKPLREKILGMVQPDFADGLEIKAAALGNDAGMAGAVKYFIDSASRRQDQ